MGEPLVPRGTVPWWVAPVVQAAVFVGLVVAWLTGESDASATTVDWGFVALTLGTPAVLACAFLAGWLVRRRARGPGSRALRVLAGFVHWGTLVVLVPTAVLALPVTAVAIMVEPIG